MGPCRIGRFHGKAIVGAGAVACFVFIVAAWKWELFAQNDSIVEYTNALFPEPKTELVDQKYTTTEIDYDLIRNLVRIGQPNGNSYTTQKTVRNVEQTEKTIQNLTSVENDVGNSTQNGRGVQNLATIGNVVPKFTQNEKKFRKTEAKKFGQSFSQTKDVAQTSMQSSGSGQKVSENKYIHQTFPRSESQTMTPEQVQKLRLPSTEKSYKYLPTKYYVQDSTEPIAEYSTSTEKPFQMLNPTQKASPSEIVPRKSTQNNDKLLRRIQLDVLQIVLDSVDTAVEIWLNKGNLAYDNDLLVQYVGQNLLIPPIDKSVPYNLVSNNPHPDGQFHGVWDILQNVTDGFYIDCGANNGEILLNTRWLENEKGWNGLFIEADPVRSSFLQSRHARAWHTNVCLSDNIIPKTISFVRSLREIGPNGPKVVNIEASTETKVKCIPLYTILLAMKRDVVDFFSLDIDGFGLDVLKTIPFDKIMIKTLAVDNWSIRGDTPGLENFMKEKGYTLIKDITSGSTGDVIFVLNSLLPRKPQKSQDYFSKSGRVTANEGSASKFTRSSRSSKLKNKSKTWQ